MTSSSSIPAKIGSDVNYLVFEILPRLKPGVVVHVHDVMWPFEYPKQWLMERRAWNETCIVRAFLQYNEALSFSSTAMQATVYWFSVNWKKLGWQLMSGCCCFGYV